MPAGTLRIISVEEIPSDCSEPVDAKALEQARAIVDSIRAGGEAALVATATKFGDIKEGESYTYTKEELKTAFDGLPKDHQGVLTRVVSPLFPPTDPLCSPKRMHHLPAVVSIRDRTADTLPAMPRAALKHPPCRISLHSSSFPPLQPSI